MANGEDLNIAAIWEGVDMGNVKETSKATKDSFIALSSAHMRLPCVKHAKVIGANRKLIWRLIWTTVGMGIVCSSVLIPLFIAWLIKFL